MIGGMNHYLLPFAAAGGTASSRFGSVAIESLVAQVIALGGEKNRLRAKLFGGACVIEAFREKTDHIGIVNAQIAETILQGLAIPVVEQDLGGRRGRKLMFNTDNGESWVKYL
jgi:chemotaxis protein CheD